MSLASLPPHTYVPELHDVSPCIGDRVDRMLDLLPDDARSVTCLLVVPDWEGAWPIDRHPEFAAALQRRGNQRVLHGYTHSLGPDLWNRVVWGTDDHAEFRRTRGVDAERLLDQGQQMFERAFGERARWFCAPRWQLSPAAAAALPRAGLSSHMTRGGFVHAGGTREPVPAVWFDNGRRGWLSRVATVARRRQVARLVASRRAFRLSLHPADLDDPLIVDEIRRLVRLLRDDGWTPTCLPEQAA